MKSVILFIPLIFGSAFALQCFNGSSGCDNDEEGNIILLFQVTDDG